MTEAPAVARFTLNGDDYGDGTRAIMRRQLTFWIGPALGATTLVVGILSGSGLAIGWSLVVLAIAAAAYWISPGLRWKRSQRLAVEQEHSFDDGGITVRAGKEQGRLAWDFYVAVAETGSAYVLFRTRRQANFVPKRGFVSPEDEARFRALAAEHVKTSWANGR